MSEEDGVSRRPPPRRAGRRKHEVLDAAAIVIADRGADATRFVDVAQESGVPVSTLQYYFGSREDLLVAAFRHASETEIAEMASVVDSLPDPWEQIVYVVDDALNGYRPGDDRAGRLWIEAWRFGLRDEEMRSDVHLDYEHWHRLIARSVGDGVRTGRFATNVAPHDVAIVTLALLDGVGLRLVAGDPLVDFGSARSIVLSTLSSLLTVSAT